MGACSFDPGSRRATRRCRSGPACFTFSVPAIRVSRLAFETVRSTTASGESKRSASASNTALTNARERINVDAKYKQKPRAMERIFTALGVSKALGLDRCLVATTDSKRVAAEFGRTVGVTVLDGDFLTSLVKKHEVTGAFLMEEQLIASFGFDGMGKFTGDWAERWQASKSWLLTDLGFRGCARWLTEIRDMCDAATSNPQRRGPALRLLYLNAAFFLVGVDFAFARYAFDSAHDRRQMLTNGFRYGSDDFAEFDNIARLAAKMAAVVTGRPLAGFRATIDDVFVGAGARSEILADYFAKHTVAAGLVSMARQLSSLGYTHPLVEPSDAPSDVRGFLGMLLDYLAVERSRLL
jgi:hypothetical protein